MPSNRSRTAPHPASTPRGGATRERLLLAAIELLEEGGYAAASVAAITARSDVAAGALYRHFPSKEELFVEVFRTAAEQELGALYEASVKQGSVSEKLDAVVRKFTSSALNK